MLAPVRLHARIRMPAHPRAVAPASDASRPAPAVAGSACAVVAPAGVLHAPRLLLLSPRVLLCLHKRACAWGSPSCMRERGWEHRARNPGCMLHRGRPSLVVQGRLVLHLARSDTLDALMHFDQGVLDQFGCVHIRLLELARDRQRWMGTCNKCLPAS
jgi:hypothetical protein